MFDQLQCSTCELLCFAFFQRLLSIAYPSIHACTSYVWLQHKLHYCFTVVNVFVHVVSVLDVLVVVTLAAYKCCRNICSALYMLQKHLYRVQLF